MKRTVSLCGVVLNTATKCILTKSTYVPCLGMTILTKAQHTSHIYCHVFFHQVQGRDHFPLCIQVFHLSHKAEKHYIHPEEQGKELDIHHTDCNAFHTVFRIFIILSASLPNAQSHLEQCQMPRSSLVSTALIMWFSMVPIYLFIYY